MEEYCIVCGAVIPEGRQVCPLCEKSVLPKRRVEPIGKVYTFARDYKQKEGVDRAIYTETEQDLRERSEQ